MKCSAPMCSTQLAILCVSIVCVFHCTISEYCGKGDYDCRDRMGRVILLDCPDDLSLAPMIVNTIRRKTLTEVVHNQDTLLLIAPTTDTIRLSVNEATSSELIHHCTAHYDETTSGNNVTVVNFLSVLKDVLLDYSTDMSHLEIIALLFSTEKLNSDCKAVLPFIDDIIDLSNMNKYAMHFFIGPNAKSTELIGSTEHSVTYEDSTHFNKALTLSQLLKKKIAESLQAHLLSKGILVTTNKFEAFFNFPFPTVKEVFGVDYMDLCASISCPSDSFCSPLHGCVKQSEIRSGNIKGKISLSDDDFSLAHDSSPSTLMKQANLGGLNIKLSILEEANSTVTSSSSNVGSYSLSNVVESKLEAVHWKADKPFINQLISKRRPALLKNTVVNTWKAFKEEQQWTIDYVCDNMAMKLFPNVKCSNSFLTFDPDHRAPLKLNISIPYIVENMTKDEFCSCVQSSKTIGCKFKGYYYFGAVPDTLKQDLKPNDYLFQTEKDLKSKKQFIWISSEGMITHGHFDQDYNIFVQLVGHKRFTLWLPWQHEMMYIYPRIHPLWHKSRINFRSPDISRFPDFSRTHAIQVDVGPGDILYIPPYTWHYVETISPSISLSTWSHDYQMYDHMNAIYGHDHKFDLLQNTTGQMFALRMYLDLLVQDLYGFNETLKYFSKLLAIRFKGMEHFFPPRPEDSMLCNPVSIPTCQHVYGYVKLDIAIVSGHFKALATPEVMDILFMDYVEEITAQVVGIDQLLAFFRYCFQGQDYYMTEIDEPEHSLWD